MHLILVRHALPLRVEGTDRPADPGLSELGRLQAEEVATYLSQEPISEIWSSPLKRAYQTARPLASRLEFPIVRCEELAESDRDSPVYVPMEELRATGDERWHQLVAQRFGDGEPASRDPFCRRIVSIMERIVHQNADRSVVVFCHAGVINAYLGWVVGIEKRLWFEPRYASVSRVLASRRGHRSVDTINEVYWRAGSDRPQASGPS
jgi:broad specificity phosphatase PhoE